MVTLCVSAGYLFLEIAGPFCCGSPFCPLCSREPQFLDVTISCDKIINDVAELGATESAIFTANVKQSAFNPGELTFVWVNENGAVLGAAKTLNFSLNGQPNRGILTVQVYGSSGGYGSSSIYVVEQKGQTDSDVMLSRATTLLRSDNGGWYDLINCTTGEEIACSQNVVSLATQAASYGGVFAFAAGTFDVKNSTIIISQPITVRGQGTSTLIISSTRSQSSYIRISSSHVTLEYLALKGWIFNSTGAVWDTVLGHNPNPAHVANDAGSQGIEIANARDVIIRNNFLSNFSWAIEGGGIESNITVTSNTIQDVAQGIFFGAPNNQKCVCFWEFDY
jgi:hypothetical protein